jgi:hypothetical protein
MGQAILKGGPLPVGLNMTKSNNEITKSELPTLGISIEINFNSSISDSSTNGTSHSHI